MPSADTPLTATRNLLRKFEFREARESNPEKRPCIDAKSPIDYLFAPHLDPVTMHWLECHHHQNQHIQSALNQVTRRGIGTKTPPGHQEEGYATHLDCQDVTEQVGRYVRVFFFATRAARTFSLKNSTALQKGRMRGAAANAARLLLG